MDLRKIKKLIELVEESGIAELEVKSGEEAVRITMNSGTVVSSPPTVALPAAVPAMAPAADAAGGSVAKPTEKPEGDSPPGAAIQSAAPVGTPLNAPLSGTFYVASSPDAPPFVAVGDRVAAGDVLCIIESMKMMNRIEADRAGVVVGVLVSNGEPVESGQPLLLLDSQA